MCIANLDEPTDPGVLVEIMFAHMMGKPVLGYRTEARSPYGTLFDYTKGMHFFKFFPLDAFLTIPIPKNKKFLLKVTDSHKQSFCAMIRIQKVQRTKFDLISGFGLEQR